MSTPENAPEGTANADKPNDVGDDPTVENGGGK